MTNRFDMMAAGVRQVPVLLSALLFVILLAAAPVRPVWAQDGEVGAAQQEDRGSDIDAEKEIKICVSMINRVSRLSCFDNLAAHLGFLAPEQAAQKEKILDKYGFWEVTKKKNAVGEEIIYLKNDALEEVVSKGGVQRRPTLVIKCKSGQTDVYLDWKAQLVPFKLARKTLVVTSQFNAASPEAQNWEVSTDHNALFAPDPVEFVKKMRQNTKLITQFTPPEDFSQTVVNDISGLDSVLGLLVEECYN